MFVFYFIGHHAGHGGGGKFGGWGGVKSRIFMLTYKGQFWSYDDVVDMFPVRFELKKHLRIISEHSEHAKQFFGGFEASPWRKTALK